MDTFSVILEDATEQVVGHNKISFYSNRRVTTIEANDLDDAWWIARTMYYFQKTDIQIVDIKKGEVVLQDEPLLISASTEKEGDHDGSKAE